jgi:hypothetical protein
LILKEIRGKEKQAKTVQRISTEKISKVRFVPKEV